MTLTFKNVDGTNDVKLESVIVSTSAGTGIGVLAETINKNSEKTGVKASWQVQTTGSVAVAGGTTAIQSLTINGVNIGNIGDVKANDSDGKLVAAINAVKDQTGVEASIDTRGNLNLTSIDGRGIKVEGVNLSVAGLASGGSENYGKLTLTRLDARDIVVEGAGMSTASTVTEATINLRSIRGSFTSTEALAMGAYANSNVENYGKELSAGVTTLKGAMATMDIAESAQKALDRIRSDLGSTQNQLTSTINNISVTQVNVKAAESQIRDVDFAAESANFNKQNLLAQSGSYAMSQANAVQQNVMRLLQ